MLKIFVNKDNHPEEYRDTGHHVPNEEYGAGYVEAGNDNSNRKGISDHYILVDTDEDVKSIPSNDIWGTNKVKILHPLM